MIPSSFSIDYLTRQESFRSEEGGSDGSRFSPSPQKSSSPDLSESGQSSDNAESIAEVLLSLDKSIKNGLMGDPSQEKPHHSYIALISMAILSRPDRKILLSDIYQFVMDSFPYYNNKDKAWRNSIRHNLSLNECFVKNGRADNGKGNYWSIHPACVDDFARGDFRRRQARRRARKSMKDINSRPHSSDCSYNMGYVPMTPSSIGFQTFPHHQVIYPQSSFPCVPTPTVPPITSTQNVPRGFFTPSQCQQLQQTMTSSIGYPYQGW